MNAELDRAIPGFVWNFSQSIRDNVLEALSGVKGDNSVKIFGPDLAVLRDLARKFGVKDSRGILLLPELGHADFAEMIGSSRPMVSRLIAEMVANKRLLYDGKHYIVLGLEDNGCELNAAESHTKLVLTKSTAPLREQSEYRN